MIAGFDKVVGVYHFLGDRTPKEIPVVEPKPRKVSLWQRDGRYIAARVKVGEDVRDAVNQVVARLGGIEKAITRNDRVLVKPNFNSPDPPPASTDLRFLGAVVEMLLETGARVTIGESAGGIWRPTRNVFRKLGLYDFARKLDVPLIDFDEERDWVRVKINGDYLSAVTMPRSAYEADKLVYLPCLKTHRLAAHSGALKLAFGFVHPGERRYFHMGHLQEKLAEVSLCWQPDLIIMDGRKAFISGGPDQGEVVEPGLLLASADLVAIDIEAMKVILGYGAVNKLPSNPWRLPQIVTALKHGLGAGEGKYIVVD